jgi:peptidoglycan hydrolase-like protein with peptidoglycan-binding domain
MSAIMISHSELIALTTSLFHEAVEENNAGVDLIKLGEYESAIKRLYGSLSRMQRFSKIKEINPREYYHAPGHHHHHQTFESQEQSLQRCQEQEQQDLKNTSQRDEANGNCAVSSPSFSSSVSSQVATTFSSSSSSSSSDYCCGHEDYTILEAPASGISTAAAAAAITNDQQQQAPFSNNSNQQDNSTIYRDALFIRCHGHSFDAISNPVYSCSSTDVARIRASILFNLGLAHHMAAAMNTATVSVSSPDDATAATTVHNNRLLEKATTIYKLSLSLQESEQAPISADHVMALCNNLGQCYSSLHQESESKVWTERLLRLLVCQQQHHHHQQQQHDNTMLQTDCFVQNTMSLILIDPCFSPAA